jgi:hypothetical protein
LAFNNSEQAEIIPILGLVYSVKRSALSEEDEAIVLETPYPFAIDFFHGKIKPDLTVFLKSFFYELRRLSPTNDNIYETMGREFIASLRCVVADTPMRTYLKSIKSHSRYWSCERCIQKEERRLEKLKRWKNEEIDRISEVEYKEPHKEQMMNRNIFRVFYESARYIEV